MTYRVSGTSCLGREQVCEQSVGGFCGLSLLQMFHICQHQPVYLQDQPGETGCWLTLDRWNCQGLLPRTTGTWVSSNLRMCLPGPENPSDEHSIPLGASEAHPWWLWTQFMTSLVARGEGGRFGCHSGVVPNGAGVLQGLVVGRGGVWHGSKRP